MAPCILRYSLAWGKEIARLTREGEKRREEKRENAPDLIKFVAAILPVLGETIRLKHRPAHIVVVISLGCVCGDGWRANTTRVVQWIGDRPGSRLAVADHDLGHDFRAPSTLFPLLCLLSVLWETEGDGIQDTRVTRVRE